MRVVCRCGTDDVGAGGAKPLHQTHIISFISSSSLYFQLDNDNKLFLILNTNMCTIFIHLDFYFSILNILFINFSPFIIMLTLFYINITDNWSTWEINYLFDQHGYTAFNSLTYTALFIKILINFRLFLFGYKKIIKTSFTTFLFFSFTFHILYITRNHFWLVPNIR